MTLPHDATALLDRLSLAELKAMQDAVAIKVREKQDAEKADAKAELEHLARERGFDAHELFGGKTASKPKAKIAPKYRNPDNPDQTWTGRGRQPGWVKEALEAGKTLESMAI